MVFAKIPMNAGSIAPSAFAPAIMNGAPPTYAQMKSSEVLKFFDSAATAS